MSLPKTTKAWILQGSDDKGFDNLKLVHDYPVPELGEKDCLVQIQAVSLNYRDLVIPKVSTLPPEPLTSTGLLWRNLAVDKRSHRACTLSP